jgi:hypothetical protein
VANNKNPNQKQPGEKELERSIIIQATCPERPSPPAKMSLSNPTLIGYIAAMSHKTKNTR